MKRLRKATKATKFVKRGSGIQRLVAIVVIIVVAVFGYRLLVASHAATPYVAGSAASGTRSGTTALVTGESGSSSQAVSFGGSSTTPPPSGDGTCNGTTTPAAPSTSAFSGYQLTNSFSGYSGITKAPGYGAYGTDSDPIVLPPSGYVEPSHVVQGPDNSLEEVGYNESGFPGAMGAGIQLNGVGIPDSGGGMTFCYSLTPSNNANQWQSLGIVFIAWPQNQTWGDGEIDFGWAGSNDGGNALNKDIVEADGCTDNCATYGEAAYPTGGPATGNHELSVFWTPGKGDSFYIDGKFVETDNVATPGCYGLQPPCNEVPVMQLQDLYGQDGTNPSNIPQSNEVGASLYWISTYTAN